jgi:hypothetical protein
MRKPVIKSAKKFGAIYGQVPPIFWRHQSLALCCRLASKESFRAPNLLASSRPIVSPSNTGTAFHIWRMASPQAPLMTKLSWKV